MKVFCTALLFLIGVMPIGSACRAQNFSTVWSEWETATVVRNGPSEAQGLLIYFHGRGPVDVAKLPVLPLFVEMARIAKWDVLKIKRLPFADGEEEAEDILQIVFDRITAARREGYKKVILAGVSRGGWIALMGATLPGVDAVIGLAPGTTSYQKTDLERASSLLASKLAAAKARRIAIFFFEGDHGANDAQAAVIRRGLQDSGSTFLLGDRPPDLHGHSAMGTGRFFRRYRDCLLQFVQVSVEPGGEFQCPPSGGYAAGEEIGFPQSDAPLEPSVHAEPRLLPYWGRWEGDDEWGTYYIMEAVHVGARSMTFRIGYSMPPGAPRGWPSTDIQYVSFQLDETSPAIVHKFETGPDQWIARLKSDTEMDVEVKRYDQNRALVAYRFVLRKKREAAANN